MDETKNLPAITISSLQPIKVMEVLYKSKLANPSKTDVLGDDDWKFLSIEVQKDYPTLTIDDLEKIITMGIKGHLDESLTYSYVNFKTIYRWIDTWLKRNKKGRLNYKF